MRQPSERAAGHPGRSPSRCGECWARSRCLPVVGKSAAATECKPRPAARTAGSPSRRELLPSGQPGHRVRRPVTYSRGVGAVGCQERRLVDAEPLHRADAIAVSHQRGAVVDRGVHHRPPAHAELGGHSRHRPGQLAHLAAGLAPGPADEHHLGVHGDGSIQSWPWSRDPRSAIAVQAATSGRDRALSFCLQGPAPRRPTSRAVAIPATPARMSRLARQPNSRSHGTPTTSATTPPSLRHTAHALSLVELIGICSRYTARRHLDGYCQRAPGTAPPGISVPVGR